MNRTLKEIVLDYTNGTAGRRETCVELKKTFEETDWIELALSDLPQKTLSNELYMNLYETLQYMRTNR